MNDTGHGNMLDGKRIGTDFKILVVEDDEPLCRMIQTLLKMEGYSVEVTLRGDDTLKEIASNPPDLLLLDYQLPDMTGRDIVEELSAKGTEIPFVVMTGFEDIKIAVEMMKLGALDYIIKADEYISIMPQAVKKVWEQLEAKKQLKAAEEQVRRSERKYRLLFERNLAGNYHTTAEGRILDCNEAFAQIFGYDSRESIMKCNSLDLYFDRLERELFIELLKQHRALQNYELHMKRRDGSEVWILESAIMLEDEDSSQTVLQGTLIDITERKNAEQALRASEDLNRGIVTTSPLGIMYLGQNGEPIYENPVMTSMTSSLKPKKRNGARTTEIPLGEGGRKIIARLLDGEIIQGEKIKLESPFGMEKIYRIHGAPRRGMKNEIIGAVLMAMDISEYCSLEDQYRQSQKMEAIGRLAGGIAHDFNNLLMAITGHAEISLMQLAENDSSYRALSEINKAAERATALTRKLLAFSRKEPIELKIIDLNAVILGMDEMLRRIIGEDVELFTLIAPELWSVRADPSQIESVIMNLVVNARDAMPGGGKLIIETANISIEDKHFHAYPEIKSGSYALISVTDSGVGMSEATKSQIFEPFFTTKEVGKGTGLGLSTVYGIVRQSDGYIWVYSIPGKGTSFKIFLPMIKDVSSETGRDVGLNQLPRGSETLLLVEDESIIRHLTSLILKQQGYNVLDAPDGSEALSICTELPKPVDMVITDVVMPRMGGVELVRKLKVDWPQVKVLYMSGYTDNPLVDDRDSKAGIQYLQKPFNLSTLARKVREILDN